MEYARAEAHLGALVPNSTMTYRQHYEQFKKTMGRYPREMPVAKLDENTEYIWSMYASVKSPRVPLSYTEIKSWSEIMGTPVSPFEAGALMRIDAILGG